MTRIKKYDDAVSPVVGVMLMVVITVVIAAVITVFSTGLLGDETVSDPVIMVDIGKFEFKVGSEGDDALKSVEFIHKGGDTVPLDILEFTFVGSKQHITNYYSSEKGSVKVIGKSSTDGNTVMVEPGDIIKIDISYYINHEYVATEKVTWTLYNKRTDTTLANGVFVVPEAM